MAFLQAIIQFQSRFFVTFPLIWPALSLGRYCPLPRKEVPVVSGVGTGLLAPCTFAMYMAALVACVLRSIGPHQPTNLHHICAFRLHHPVSRPIAGLLLLE